MKTMKNLITATLALGTLCFAQLLNAQKLTQKTTTIAINGTSPMHDWTMTSTSAIFTGTVNGNTITNVKFVMASKNLKSEKGKMMDNKAYKALKADANPNITFTAASLPLGKSNVAGKLSIAGVTKNINLTVNVEKNGNSYKITGSESLKMSEYGMETPGFLGVTTGDAVTVNVNIVAN